MGGLVSCISTFFSFLQLITVATVEKCIIWKIRRNNVLISIVYVNSHGHLQPVKNTRQIVISQLITNLIRIFKLKLSLSFLLCVRAGSQGKSDSESERGRERLSVSGNVITCNRQCCKHLLPLMSPH